MTPKMKNDKGAVTVFFSAVMLILIAFFGALLETARYRAFASRLPQAVNAAADSLLACYDSRLFAEYGLLYYDNRDPLMTDLMLRAFFEPEADPGAGLIIKKPQLFKIEKPDITIKEGYSPVDNGGEDLFRQIMAIMKYQEAADIAEKLKSLIDGSENAQDIMDQAAKEGDELEDTDWQEKANELEKIDMGLTDEDEDPPPAFDGQVNERVKDDVGGSVIGQMENILAQELLSQVLPGREISNAVIESYAPDVEGSVEMEFYEKVLLGEYVLSYFGNINSPSGQGLAYEQEYILFGFSSDKVNLSLTIKQLFYFRAGMDLITIMVNKPLSSQAKGMAQMLVGWTGIPGLAGVVEIGLELAWAFGEAILDLRTITAGRSVPFYKKAAQFDSTLATILSHVLSGDGASSENGGIGYEMYMRFFLYQKNDVVLPRIMHMIETNLRAEDKGFTFSKLLYGFKVSASGTVRGLFFPAYRLYTEQSKEFVCSAESIRHYS